MPALPAPRLGAGFSRLWIATAVSNVGDGVTMAAGPLLIASVSGNPALIAGAVFAQQVPWLLFGLISGAFVDRLDRRRLIVVVNLARAVALAALAVSVGTGVVSVAVIYAVVFLLGTAETLADTAAGALLPSLVAPSLLPRANARLAATFNLGQQFAAKPLGAWLFVVSAAVPFGFDALTFAVAAALIAGLAPAEAPAVPRTSLRAEIRDGVRWLWRNRVLRTIAVSIGVGNVAFGAAFAVFVVYCRERLGLSEIGYGFLLTVFAAGGLVGSAVAAGLTHRFGGTAVLRAGLLVEVLTHLTLALTTSPWVAGGVLAIFSVHATVWGVVVASIRQRTVPAPLLGRVGSAYALLDVGGAAVGSLLGGLLATTGTITTPFWAAASAMAVVAACAWRAL